MNIKSWVYAVVILLPLSSFAQLDAFPGAQGAGRYATGGRGGDVYEVTNLNDSGEGSLREALRQSGPKTIVFRVSGTIQLESTLDINTPNTTIAGQTAPGDGICIRGYQVQLKADNLIIRHLRFRLGDESGEDHDAIWGRYYRNIIIDHCSASWSVDETMSFYGNFDMTVQWCIISESLYMSNHIKGAHGYGGIWGGTNVSFHHNLLAHHSSRNPRFAGSSTAPAENMDFRNNVIYNWGFNSAYGGEGGNINIVANYFKAGPATKDSKKARIVEPSDQYGKWYIEDNYVDGFPTITADNWNGGVQGSYAIPILIRASEPLPYTAVYTQTAEEAFESVLFHAGASQPKRDAVDLRIVDEVRNGYATYDGKYYELYQGFTDTTVNRGIIDSQNDVGGWPVLETTPAPIDTDHDGMPDDWELAMGLNPNDPEDRNNISDSGYTRLEDYLNNLAPVVSIEPEMHVMLELLQLHQNYPNPFNAQTQIKFSLKRSEFIDLKIYDISGHLIRTLGNMYYPPGSHQVVWNARNESGHPAPSGLYLLVLQYADQQDAIKMQLLR